MKLPTIYKLGSKSTRPNEHGQSVRYPAMVETSIDDEGPHYVSLIEYTKLQSRFNGLAEAFDVGLKTCLATVLAVSTIQAQPVDRSTEMQGKPVDDLTNLQGQQQPVIGAGDAPSDVEFDGWAEDLSRLGYDANREGVETYLRQIFADRTTLAQQDADKADAERYRSIRKAMSKNDQAFIIAMRKYGEANFADTESPTFAEWDEAVDAASKGASR